MQLCLTFLPLLATLLFFVSPSSLAQAPPPRLLHALRGQKPVPLPGSATPDLLRADDRGAVPDSTPLHGITLVFHRSEAQEADLQQLLIAQQDPASPNYHHWLTPEAFGRRFGIADADLDLTKSWLQQQGFTVTAVSNAHDRITFSGTAGVVRTAFGTTLHHVEFAGEPHVAPDSAISLPADLAAITTAVLHLSDFRPQPMARLAPRPAYTTANTQAHYLTPPDLAVMYDLPAATPTFRPGTGQSIAIVGQSYVDLSIGAVTQEFLTTVHYYGNNSLIPVLVPGTGVQAVSPGDAAESEIDLEYAAGMLSGSTIFLVYVGSDPTFSVFDALSFTIDQNLAPVVSLSYSACEAVLSPSELQQGNSLFEQATLQGQTLVAAAGDAGSTACAPYSVSSHLSSAQQEALSVGYPADSPYVTAVGGTQMAPSAFTSGDSPYWSGPVNTYDSVQTLLSYVPEVVWNEDSTTRGLFAGGGGASTAFGRPSWQTALPGIPQGATRLLPDVSFQASAANPGFLFCSDDVYFVGSLLNTECSIGLVPQQNYLLAGGTSFAAPTFAAMVALINQGTLSVGQGNINPLLYQLAADPQVASSVFHDITSGTIACSAGIPGCSAAGQTAFAATAGYDQATGLGSLDVSHLLAALPPPDPNLQPTIVGYVQAFNNIASPGDSDAIYINVSSVAPFPNPATPPSGAVSVSVDGVVVDPSLPFSTSSTLDNSSSVTYTLTAPSTSGSHLVTATYPGDSTHGPSTSATSVLVGQVTATGSVNLFVGAVSLPANGTATATVSVTPVGGYNGRLLWSLDLASNTGAALTACYRIPDLLVNGASTTTLSLGAGTACSSSAAAGRANLRSAHVRAGTVPGDTAPWRTVPIAAAGFVLLCALPTRGRRGLTPLVCLLLLLLTALTLAGCGSGSGNGNGGGQGGGSNPIVNTYTGTLTARDSVNGSIYTSTTFTITVR